MNEWNETMKNHCESKNKSNVFNEFIHYPADLIRPLHIFHVSLSNTYISDSKREYSQFRLCHIRHAIECAHCCTCLRYFGNAFFCASKRKFWEVSQNFQCNYFFKMLMDGLSKTPMNASGWMIIEKWGIVAKWYWCQVNEH